MSNEEVGQNPRKHTFLGRVDAPETFPEIEHGEISGELVAYLPLTGRNGVGRTAIIGDDDLGFVLFVRKWWGLSPDGYVQTGAVLNINTGQPHTARPRTILARLLTGALGRNEVVWYRNGNKLDLRRGNLEVISRAEFNERRAALKRTAKAA